MKHKGGVVPYSRALACTQLDGPFARGVMLKLCGHTRLQVDLKDVAATEEPGTGMRPLLLHDRCGKTPSFSLWPVLLIL